MLPRTLSQMFSNVPKKFGRWIKKWIKSWRAFPFLTNHLRERSRFSRPFNQLSNIALLTANERPLTTTLPLTCSEYRCVNALDDHLNITIQNKSRDGAHALQKRPDFGSDQGPPRVPKFCWLREVRAPCHLRERGPAGAPRLYKLIFSAQKTYNVSGFLGT